MHEAQYVIERWPLGWVLCGVPRYGRGIPMDALNECMSLFPKDAVIDSGIVHHLRQTVNPNSCICVVSKNDGKKWREEIEETLKSFSPEQRWLKGLDVGSSSATIFSVFCDRYWTNEAQKIGNGSVPMDSDDFGRCKRLLDKFPEWKSNLKLVALAYPKWTKIVERWDEIENSTPMQQNDILGEINSKNEC